MAIPVDIRVGTIPLMASKLGQLIVAPYAYDLVVSIVIDTNNTAFNFYKPKSHHNFIITSLLLGASTGVKDWSLIDVYSANSEDSTAIKKSILHAEVRKNDYRDIVPMNVLVEEGDYINVKTDDKDVYVTITGYYIPVVA